MIIDCMEDWTEYKSDDPGEGKPPYDLNLKFMHIMVYKAQYKKNCCVPDSIIPVDQGYEKKTYWRILTKDEQK